MRMNEMRVFTQWTHVDIAFILSCALSEFLLENCTTDFDQIMYLKSSTQEIMFGLCHFFSCTATAHPAPCPLQSFADRLQFVHFNILLASLSTASIHLPLGLPTGILPSVYPFSAFLGSLSSFILSTWPNNWSRLTRTAVRISNVTVTWLIEGDWKCQYAGCNCLVCEFTMKQGLWRSW